MQFNGEKVPSQDEVGQPLTADELATFGKLVWDGPDDESHA